MKAQQPETQTLPGMKNGQKQAADSNNNVLDFSSTLKELRKHVPSELVRQRDGWRDRNGNMRTIEYIEWHTVADILDETAPNWAHSIKDIRVLGDVLIVTVAITIDGVTREGIGTGSSTTEMGIKKAEHDALKRAAVKFGIARELYKKEFDEFDRSERDRSEPRSQVQQQPAQRSDENAVPQEPIARSIADLITTKQLGMIRAISRERGIDADEECNALMNCKINELSRRAASFLIDRLQEHPQAASTMKRAG
ncbi:MAG: Rad52/Rad22 family DNA repair protein [Pyrinomonadaceae bacterium]|nr:Rad52/Rad22 family DNA repair protein [Pyrinomonadaceae bacterium]